MKVDAEYLIKKYPSCEDEIRSLAKTAPKRLLFALKLVDNNGNQTKTYLSVYNNTDPDTVDTDSSKYHDAGANATKLTKDYRVSRIVETISHEATQAVIENVELSREKILQDLEEIKQKGIEINQLGPAARATELQGKEIGMFVDRSEMVHRSGDADLMATLEAIAPGLALEAQKTLAIPGEFTTTDTQSVGDDN